MELNSLLGLEGVSKDTISYILEEAKLICERLDRGERQFGAIKGKTVVTLFYENSTRTRTSFENACKFLGGTACNVAVASSSVAKGESLLDTGRTLERLKTDLIVIRHSASGAAKFLSDNLGIKVINAGDGLHEHPTQALLDMSTMMEIFGHLEGLKVAIIGDIKHSRVARSNIYGLTTMGAEVRLAGPRTLIPQDIADMGATVCSSVEEAVTDADVVMGLRIQLERQKKGLFPSVAEYAKYYGINAKRMALAKPNAVLMHPGPVNRGIEIDSATIDCDQSFIDRQVTHGLAVRMAILKMMLGEQ